MSPTGRRFYPVEDTGLRFTDLKEGDLFRFYPDGIVYRKRFDGFRPADLTSDLTWNGAEAEGRAVEAVEDLCPACGLYVNRGHFDSHECDWLDAKGE